MNTDRGDRDVGPTEVTIADQDDFPGLPPLSEVGCPSTSAGHPTISGVNKEYTVDSANQLISNNISADFFSQMMQTMKQMSDRLSTQQCEKVKINDIFLPSFDPDGGVGIREWCQHVAKAIDIYNLNDYEIRMKVGSLLKGRAKLWVDNWLVSTSSWEELRDNLILTFEPENRYSRDVIKFREHSFDHTKNIAEFLSQAWVLWKRVTKNKLGNDDAVEAVIGCVNDERLRIDLMNARATSVPELISVASTIRVKRFHTNTNPSQTNNKRTRLNDSQTSLHCVICKKNNHHTRDCRFKTSVNDSPLNKDVSQNTTSSKSNSTQNKPTCTFCMKAGHTSEKCFKRERSIVSNVNCIAPAPGQQSTVSAGPDDISPEHPPAEDDAAAELLPPTANDHQTQG
ncbi:hypothetical protein HF086_005787 [Spodoptera exigua]|uniref:Retrotransposon gag domain-containing protein n=1 Tax=Spodoptera exigua TaxID=7107 RepID=A0A922SHW8_SPOEX|nr:hypothetical protein HF086_005787 [Spodoptera exigua]